MGLFGDIFFLFVLPFGSFKEKPVVTPNKGISLFISQCLSLFLPSFLFNIPIHSLFLCLSLLLFFLLIFGFCCFLVFPCVCLFVSLPCLFAFLSCKEQHQNMICESCLSLNPFLGGFCYLIEDHFPYL